MSSDAIRVTKRTNKKERPKDKDLAFGNVFTDHMFVADFQEEKGWYDPRVEPYAPFALDPATAVRSEEHTSELQSLTNLVCRLLLEKKKKTTTRTNRMSNTYINSTQEY